MSEEVKETAENAEASEAVEVSSKKKKINKLSKDDLNKKIKALQEANQTGSKYYVKLLDRKAEIEA